MPINGIVLFSYSATMLNGVICGDCSIRVSRSCIMLYLVLVSPDSITLLELSVVTNTKHYFLAAIHRKQDRYGPRS